MTKFLESIALAYRDNYKDMTDFCFVFPSKRSGQFFIKYLSDAMKSSVALSPKVTTINDFIAQLSDRDIDNRIDLLFILYKEYVKMIDEDIPFDKFRGWGDIILNDFNEVDMSCVNPDAIFKNLGDLKEIQSNFLTEEQEQIINEYFGSNISSVSASSFWNHFNKDDDSTSKNRFLKLWQALAPLYHNFNEELDRRNLSYSGSAYRLAYQKVKQKGKESIPYKKVIFVGFNVLSTIECLLFTELQKLKNDVDGKSFADFYWDSTGPAMNDDNNSAVRFISKNKKMFKSQFDISSSDRNSFPSNIQSISCPSNTTQAKKIGEILGQICPQLPINADKKKIDEINKSNTDVVVVLPDEELLLPLLHSFPENVNTANLTMGYSIKLTSTASFITLLRKAYDHSRQQEGETLFYYEDVKAIFAHPYSLLIIGYDEILKAKKQINQERKFNISTSQLSKYTNRKTDQIFCNINKDASAQETIDQLDSVLERMQSIIEHENDKGLVRREIELDSITAYREALTRIQDALNEHKIDMRRNTLLLLVDRLVGSEKVTFEGEPLVGVQIMGILETRCLDFDNIIIPSMNERIFPRRIQSSSFIPNSLRQAYGMPTPQYQESIFSYYFYRMISRAKNVYMLYDARSSGLKSGDQSRYITQLQYLYKDANVQSDSLKFNVFKKMSNTISVKKDEHVMAILDMYKDPDSKKNLSVSALKNYLACPLKFYLTNIVGVCAEEEPSEFMDAIMIGNVLHSVMQHIYSGKSEGVLNPEKCITSEYIDSILDDIEMLKHTISQHIYCACNGLNLNHYDSVEPNNLTGSAQIFIDVIYQYVKAILEEDRDNTPFNYVGSEVSNTFQWNVSDDLTINVRYIIDRIDRVGNVLRMVDYKTGRSDDTTLKKEKLLEESSQNAIFQLLMYANLYAMQFNYKGPIKPSIYKVLDLVKKNKTTDIMAKFDKTLEPITDYNDINNDDIKINGDKFMNQVIDKVKEIFNPDKDFVQADAKKCKNCNFLQLCNRKEPSY